MFTVISNLMQTSMRRRTLAVAMIALCLILIAAVAHGPFSIEAPAVHHSSRSSLENVPPLDPVMNVDSKLPEQIATSRGGTVTADFKLATPTADSAADSEAQLALATTDATNVKVASGARSAGDKNLQLLKEPFELMKIGREQFRRIPSYTATLIKQERIGSTLADEVTMQIKVRHEPFSVYMKWLTGDPGKELLYVGGTNDGQLLVRLGGFKGRILPALKIDPEGPRAMAESRYPIMKLGILALTDKLIEERAEELRDKRYARCLDDSLVDVDGRPCRRFVFEFADSSLSPVYRKSVQCIDRQWNVAIEVANYTWPERPLTGAALDEATLIEYYKYSEIVADAQLSDADFDRANAEYRFHR